MYLLHNRGADRRRVPCKQAQLDCAAPGVRSSTLFRRVAPEQGTRSQHRDSRRRSRRERPVSPAPKANGHSAKETSHSELAKAKTAAALGVRVNAIVMCYFTGGILRSLQILFTKISLISLCLGIADLLFNIGLCHHE